MQSSTKVIAQLIGANKRYKSGDTEITALQATTLDFRSNELALIIGPSGSGKTTLLSLLGCVIYPTEGEVLVGGNKVREMSETQLSNLRLNYIGFVFQNFNLVAPLTALENVMFPLTLQGVSGQEAKARALQALEGVGMADRKNFKPKQLSGGQQQRVAIARALVTKPQLLLCDEPTASLDAVSMVSVLQELHRLSKEGIAVAIVTHDPRLKEYADRTIYVESGRVTDNAEFSIH
ncbi:MAG: ABC transporter ATP-binding protein [Cytophagaceae bacterium]|jgi:putative ABC transport system ATP-binding protein|nr:ABC transporter ATP-binding protein [Cytophagaceae bacterium]